MADPSTSHSEGGKPSTADSPSFNILLDGNDLVVDDLYNLDASSYGKSFGGDEISDLPSSFLEEMSKSEARPEQQAMEPLELVEVPADDPPFIQEGADNGTELPVEVADRTALTTDLALLAETSAASSTVKELVNSESSMVGVTRVEPINTAMTVWKPPCQVKPRPLWLPEGWSYFDVERTAGATAGRVDRYYYSPGGLLRFRSKVEVFFYIKHGRGMKKEDRQKRKNCGPSTAQENTQGQLWISPSASGDLDSLISPSASGDLDSLISPSASGDLDSLRNTRRFIRSHGNHHQ